jgi:hypothetical protein
MQESVRPPVAQSDTSVPPTSKETHQQRSLQQLFEQFDPHPNLWRPQRGDLAHQLFVHQGTHVV